MARRCSKCTLPLGDDIDTASATDAAELGPFRVRCCGRVMCAACCAHCRERAAVSRGLVRCTECKSVFGAADLLTEDAYEIEVRRGVNASAFIRDTMALGRALGRPGLDAALELVEGVVCALVSYDGALRASVRHRLAGGAPSLAQTAPPAP